MNLGVAVILNSTSGPPAVVGYIKSSLLEVRLKQGLHLVNLPCKDGEIALQVQQARKQSGQGSTVTEFLAFIVTASVVDILKTCHLYHHLQDV